MNTLGNTRQVTILGFSLVLGAVIAFAAKPAHAQTKIGKVKSVRAIVQCSDKLLVFCSTDGRRVDTLYTSTDATGKTWNAPIRVQRFGAAIAVQDVVYIVAQEGKKFVLDTLSLGKSGAWEFKQNVATVVDASGGAIIGASVSLAIHGQDLWVGCGWREDQGLGGGRKATNIHYVVTGSPIGKWNFQKAWDNKESDVAAYNDTLIGIWNGKPAIYTAQHYVASVVAPVGQNWKVMDKIFDIQKFAKGWVGGYGTPSPEVIGTPNGFLHVAQFSASTDDGGGGGLYLQSLSDKGVPAFLELGGLESKPQFAAALGNDVLVGVQGDVVERIEDMEKKNQALTIMRCTLDATTKKYKKTDHETPVTDTQTFKGGMVAPPLAVAGKPLPVAYVEEGRLYVALINIK